jgi:trigger factor
MKISTEITPDRQAIVTVEVDEDQMQGALKRAAVSASRARPVPGFRPGKAPYEMVERLFGRELLVEEAVDDLARKMYGEVLDQNELRPIDVGQLEIVQKEPPIFKYTIPVQPEVKLGDYKAVRMTPPEVEVTDAEVDEVIERFQLTQATVVPVSRAVQKGDTVTLDVAGGVPDGEQMDEKGLRVTVADDKGIRLPFDEQLIGMNAGETREIEHAYPDDFEDETVRGKTARYTVTVHDIKETQLPQADDEFVQAVSEFKTLDQFRGNIREILRRQKERDTEVRFANDVLQAVTEQSEVAYPPVMLEKEVEQDLENLKQDVKRLGLTWDNYLRLSSKTEEQVRADIQPGAEKRLKQLLVLSELIRAEDIKISREELNQEIDRRIKAAVEDGANANVARRSYNARDARENIEFNMRVSRVISMLVAQAKGEATSGRILTPEMLRGEESPIPSGLITDPQQVRQELARGFEVKR